MVEFILAHLAWNTISNIELQCSFNALQIKLVLPSASTLSNICRREYTLALDAIKKQLYSRKKISLALDRWTSTNKLATRSVIANCLDCNWASREAQLPSDDVDSQCFSYFKISFWITGQGSTYVSMACETFAGNSCSF
jgi:hypothetical protein